MSNKQKRGKRILESLEASLKSLAAEAKQSNKAFKYNASELQRVSGISRVTQTKYAKEIDFVLEKIGAEEKIKYGKAGVQHLLERVANQEQKIKSLESELLALRGQHVMIFDKMFEQSIDLSVLLDDGQVSGDNTVIPFKKNK